MEPNIDPNTGLPIQPMTSSQETTIYQSQGYPYQQPQGYPYQQQNYPQQPQGYPYQQQNYPQQPQGYPYQQQVTPPAPLPTPAPADGVTWPSMNKPHFQMSKGAIIAIIAAVAVVVAGVLFYCLYWNNPHRALMSATKKTLFDGGYLFEEIGKYKPDSVKNGVDVNLEMEEKSSYSDGDKHSYDSSVNVKMARDGSAIQLSGSVEADGDKPVDFKAEFNDTAIKVNVDKILDGTAVYDYKSDDYGYLDDLLDDEADLGQESLNKVVEMIYKMLVKSDTADLGKTEKAVKKRLDEIKIESTGSEKYEVDGKERNCKGYTMTITGDDMADIVEIACDTFAESMQKEMDDLWSEIEDEFEDSMDDLIYELEHMEDIDISYWLYKGKFACVEVEYDGDLAFGIQFLGGDFRLQNVEVYDEDGDTFFIVEGERDGDEDIFTFIDVNGKGEEEEILTMTFNCKDKTLTIEQSDENNDEEYDESYSYSEELVFVIHASKNSLEIEVDRSYEYKYESRYVESKHSSTAKGTIKVYNNPTLEEFEEDDPFYINSASKKELEKWAEEIEDAYDKYFYGD